MLVELSNEAFYCNDCPSFRVALIDSICPHYKAPSREIEISSKVCMNTNGPLGEHP